jgi:AcrR family transcriptional regulator
MPSPSQAPSQVAPRASLTARADSRDQAVQAARACFARYGVRRTTMEQVAEEAGTTRAAMYRLFLGRRELVEASAARRIAEIADDITARVEVGEFSADGFLELFTQVSIEVIENIRHDGELNLLLGDGSPVTLPELVWLPDVVERGLNFWRPWLDRAKALGAIRADLSVEELSEWLQTVYPAIILRRIPVTEERALIERFVLASVALVRAPAG